MEAFDKVTISVEQAQQLFSKSRATIYNWIKTGKVKSILENDEKVIIIDKEEYNNLLSNAKLDKQQQCLDSNLDQLDYNDSIIESNNSNDIPEARMNESMDLIKFLVLENKNLTNEIINTNKEKSYYESQVKLLTVNDDHTRGEFNKLQAENKELMAKLEILNSKLENKQSNLSNWLSKL